jgi:hypothetical protein
MEVIFCAGMNLAVAAGTQRASEYLPVGNQVSVADAARAAITKLR